MVTQVLNPEREISRGIVGIYKEYFGRGPTWARTSIADTHVTVLLEDALTVVERRLVLEGNNETVRSLRQKVQQAMSDDMVELVERVTGQKVKCMLSDHHVPTERAVEVLAFEREDGDVAATNGDQAQSPTESRFGGRANRKPRSRSALGAHSRLHPQEARGLRPPRVEVGERFHSSKSRAASLLCIELAVQTGGQRPAVVGRSDRSTVEVGLLKVEQPATAAAGDWLKFHRLPPEDGKNFLKPLARKCERVHP